MIGFYPGRVTLRAPNAERLVAWAAAVVGVIGLVSALTPEMANRVEIVGGVLPPGWPEAARVLTTPTVVKEFPGPARRATGDLSDAERVLYALDLTEGPTSELA